MNAFSCAAAAAALILGQMAPASATTITFDGLTDYLIDEAYVEQGVSVTATTPGGGLSSFFTPGTVHLDDSGTGETSGVFFTSGGIFDVLGFSFTSLGFNFYDEAPTVVGNLIIRGFLNGTQVVRDRVTLSPVYGTIQDIVLGTAFSGLDGFSIEILYPSTEALCDSPCGHLDLDSVTFAGITPVPVPVPASGFLFGTAMAGLWLMRRRRQA